MANKYPQKGEIMFHFLDSYRTPGYVHSTQRGTRPPKVLFDRKDKLNLSSTDETDLIEFLFTQKSSSELSAKSITRSNWVS